MAIIARELSVRGYRNFDEFELALDPGVSVLVGRNAQGKTNLIEAVQLLTAGASFRRPCPRELLAADASAGRIALTLEGDGRRLDHACELTESKRCFTRNGKRVTAAGVRGALPSVLFCPDDLDMVKRSAAVRRAALDDFGCQLNERYAHLAATYARVVEQRNNLLREGPCDPGLMEAWDESLVGAGAALARHRMALLERVRAHFRRVHAAIAPAEQADVAYVCSWDGPGEGDAADPRVSASAAAREVPSVAMLEGRFRDALDARRSEEARRRMTLVGPHRDEVLFSIDGRPARAFGSQGQQRTLVLAWKIAEVEVTRDILGRPPILLLDDVMSELDEGRRAAMMGFVEGGIQTVVTTTNLGYFDAAALDRAKVVRIGGEA